MNTKHTPGAWSASGTAVWSDKQLVASVYGDDPDCKPDERMKANARLIAAAPELLEALKLCAGVCAGETLNKRTLVLALCRARAAIAKATGDQP